MTKKTPQPSARMALMPLIDIAFLVLIFFMALPMKHLAFKLEQQLPTRDGIVAIDEAEPKQRVRVRLRMRGEQVAFLLGDHVADRPAGLERVLRSLGPGYVYEVQASPAVPWKSVVAMVNQLAALAYDEVSFYGTRVPTPELRKRNPLPRPG